jgi:hypothetical protein
MPNAWVQHVKKFALKNNKSYGCAISDPECKQSYKKSNIDVNSLENELKNINTHYYAILIKDSIIPSMSGKRAKHSIGEKPNDYYIKYNNLKDKLEKQTGKKYPKLESIAEFKKNNKKNAKNIDKQEINQTKIQNETYIAPLKKKKSGIIF